MRPTLLVWLLLTFLAVACDSNDGKLKVTLKGDRIVPEFLDILNEYVARTYPAR